MITLIFCGMSFVIGYQIGGLMTERKYKKYIKQSEGWNNGR